MTEKLTPEELVEALKNCAEGAICTEKCPYHGEPDCSGSLILDAAELIERMMADGGA